MILVELSGTVQFPKIPERREGGVDKRKEKEDRGKEERRVETGMNLTKVTLNARDP